MPSRARPTPGTGGIGFFSMPARVPPPPATDPVKEALTRTLEDIRTGVQAQTVAGLARAVGPATDGHPAAAPLPQPATVQDVLAVNRDAREAADSWAKSAEARAAAEEARRREAEERAAKAFEAGVAEAEGKWQAITSVREEIRGELAAIREQLRAAEASAAEARHARELAAREAEIARAQEEAAREKARAEALRQELAARPKVEEIAGQALMRGEVPSWVATVARVSGLTQPEDDPNREFQRAMVPVMVEAQRRLLEKQASLGEKQEQFWDVAIEAARGLAGLLRGAVPPPRRSRQRVIDVQTPQEAEHGAAT